mgnify:CR=1 FL=1
MQKLKKRGGFTLVELIVVLVILAILAALLIPALTGYIDKSKKDQVVAETRMLHEAVQTVASEAYGSSEWGTINDSGETLSSLITIASADGKYKTGVYAGQASATLKNRYDDIIKLAEVPSLTDGTGDFVAFTDTKGSVFCILYNTGRGLLGAYYRETGEYKVYSEQKNITNYELWFVDYKKALTSINPYDNDGTVSFYWSAQGIDAMLNH